MGGAFRSESPRRFHRLRRRQGPAAAVGRRAAWPSHIRLCEYRRHMRAIVGEGIGTALLVCAVVGSGIMGERLSGGNAALALLANSIATGAVLVTLIFTFGPISGAHFNPAVSLAA